MGAIGRPLSEAVDLYPRYVAAWVAVIRRGVIWGRPTEAAGLSPQRTWRGTRVSRLGFKGKVSQYRAGARAELNRASPSGCVGPLSTNRYYNRCHRQAATTNEYTAATANFNSDFVRETVGPFAVWLPIEPDRWAPRRSAVRGELKGGAPLGSTRRDIAPTNPPN